MKNLRALFIGTALFLPALQPAHAGECDTPRPEWFLCDDFETGSFSKWTAVYNTSAIQLAPNPAAPVVNADSPVREGANVARFHYEILASTPVHHDDNKMLFLDLRQMTGHIFVRGYVLIPANTVLYGATQSIQRKLFYIKSNIDPATGSDQHPAFGFFLAGDVIDNSVNYTTLRLGYGGRGGTGASLQNLGRIYKGRWTAIQIEAKLNSPSTSSEVSPKDGVFRLWVDNVLTYENTQMDFRSNNPNNPQSGDAGKSAAFLIDHIEVGRQVDRQNGDVVNEDRYWDNVIISRQFIPGLTGLGGNGAPGKPTSVFAR